MTPTILLKNNYNFSDIYIFGKTLEGYISLSDYELSYNCCIQFRCSSRFLIGLPSVNGGYYISDITLDEIITLAGLKVNTSFIKQIRYGVDAEAADEMIAIVCAKKILNTTFGKVYRSDDNAISYSFRRRTSDGAKRIYATFFTKSFRRGEVENGENQEER